MKGMKKSILHKLTSILLCLCMLLSTYGSYLPFFAAGAGHDDTLFDGEISLADVDLDNAKHFIIRHWHVVTENADIKDDTVVVEGYIVPNGESYDYYARTYSPVKGVAYDDDLEGFTRITESTVSSYIKLAGGKLEFMINPYHSDEEYYERFAGFSVSSGQHAVSLTDGDADNNYDGAKLTIDPSVNAPLIKSHVFYTCELLYVDGTTDYKDAEGNSLGAFPDYIDTYVDENGVKHYNSAAGLHTDKTASAYDDGRTFDLDLEAWFSGARQIDVGMILDASGSMAYTMDTLEKKANTKIDVDAIIRKLNRSSDPEVLKIAESLSKKKLTGSAGTVNVTEANILSAEELAYILNTSKTDASPLGINGYTYFVYDKRSGVNEYVPLAYWDGAQQRAVGSLYAAVMSDGTVVGGLGNASNHNQFKDAGWYYVNFGSALLTNYLAEGLESGKALWGLFGTGVAGYAEGAEFNTGAGAGTTNNNTGDYIYSHNSGKDWSPIQFIIGVDGKLCAFFNSEAKISGKQGVSYVYENPDSSYTKVEALQRAVGTFSTKLFDAAPSSHIAAVRFSTGDSAVPSNYDKFVLLDWTNDAVAAAKMLSLEYGTGGTIVGDESANGKMQYNYGLTGNTNTEQGLAAFLQELSGSVGKNDKKYVIIFTDGRDSIYNSLTPPTASTSEAYRYAQQLKAQGYTIFTALLATGTVANGMGDGVETEDYQKAAIFLKALAGTDKESGEDYFYEATDADSLVEAFARDILGAILDDLDDYNVQDYIDPRFDLVDSDSVIWHLNADGKVAAGSKNYDLLNGDAPVITLSEDPNLSDGAEKAVLKYDDDNDLYYLVWLEQNIPGCAPEATKLEVWHTRITVRAKEDFIGGNAVLTNGNSDTQNYVYKLGEDSSSGIDMSEGGKDDNPSRGFPRTTVNVKILTPGAVDGSDDFYKGETPEEFLKGLLMGLNTSDSEANPYLDYFWRYWNQCNNTENPELAEEAREAFIKAYKEALGLTDDAEVDIDFTDFESFIDAIVEALCGENHTFTLPYAYLPDIDESGQVNQTGTADHESDVLGDLIFVWNWGSDSEDSGELEIFFQAYDEDTRTESTEDLIKDKDFEYDREYKPVEGDAQDRAEAEGGYLPEYVPGELAVKLIADPYDIKWLFSEKGDWKGLSQKDFTVKVNRLEDITEGKTGAAENGEMTMTVTVKPNGEAIFYSENLSELSKGTYLMTFENGRGMYGKHVTATFRIADGSEYTERFEGDGDKTVGDLIAPNESGNNSATFELGSNEAAQADYSYLNDRFGMVVITLTVDHGVLTIRKEFADKPQTNSDDKNLEFEFTVTLSESGEYEYQVYGADQKPIAGRSGTIHSGESVMLKAGEYVVIDGLPVGTRYTVTEKTVNGFESSVGTTVTPTVSGVITVTSEETGAQEVTVVFSNKKTRNPVYVSFNGKKLLTGDNAPAIKAGDYSFTITPAGNNPENDPLKGGLTVKNIAPIDGSALIKLFDNVKYELADEDTTATYIYTVEEETGNIPGIIYAKTTYEIKIVISEKYVNGVYTGELTADVYVNGKAVTDLTSGSAVEFENKFDQNAHLNIDGTKTVNGGAPDKSFQFELTLESGNPDNVELPESTTVTSDKTSGEFSFGDIVFKAEGVYTFKVSEIEANNTGYILAEPVMIVVTVTRNSEYNTLEITVTVDGKAAVSDPKSSASITVSADNTKLDEFTLEISKEVGGLLGDKTMFFEFTVTLVRPDGLLAVNFPTTYDLDGDADALKTNGKTITFKEQNGSYVADVKLKDGQKIIIKGLLEGTKYTVQEKNYSDFGYTTTWHTDEESGSGSFKSDNKGIVKDVSVAFLNLNPAGAVSVTKTVISPEPSDKDIQFSFNMTLRKPDKWSESAFKDQKYTYSISGSGETEKGTLVLAEAGNGEFTVKLNDGKTTKQITLKHGQTLEIDNLPTGTTVSVTEDSAKGFTTDPTNGSSVVVSDKEKGEIVFKNVRDTGNLTVSKEVIGESADPKDEFIFTVTLKDGAGNELTGEYTFKTTGKTPAYDKFTSGATFTLKNGEYFTIYGLPTGTVYVVEETPADGYKTTADGKPSNKASGTITTKDAEYTAEYVNERVSEPVKESDPGTGTSREVGKEITYKITWENYKNNADSVTVVDELDVGLDYLFGSAMAYRYDPDTDTYVVVGTGVYKDHVLTWALEDQPALSRGYVTFTAIVNENAIADQDCDVVNDALVKIGNDSWFVTNEEEHPVPKGNLEVSKKVVDENIDPEEEFTFTVKFSYSYKDTEGRTHTVYLSGDYCYTVNGGDINLLTKKTDEKGNTYYEFTLKHGETVKILDLPAGVHFVVEEGPSDGYRTTADGKPSNEASGTITADGVSYTVEYVNERVSDPEKDSDPESGTMREVGNDITYTVTWENYKNNSADVTVVDELDPGLDYIEGSAKAYRYDPDTDSFVEVGNAVYKDHVITWTLPEQPALSHGYVIFTAAVNENAIVEDHGNKVVNDALVKVGNDSWFRTNEVEHPIPDPEKTEVTPGEGKIVQPDSEITYEITWENYKEYETVVTIIDPLDVNVEFVSAKFGAFDEEGEWYTIENAVDGIIYDAETHTVIWTIDAAEAKAYGKVTLVVRVTEGAISVGFVENQASVKVDNDPEVKTNIIENPAPNTDVTILKEQAVNDGERTTDWKRVQAGDIVTYYITVTNIGDIAAEGLVITDEIPEGLHLVNGSISHDGREEDGIIIWEIGTLESGEAVTVSFKITVPAVEKDTKWLNIAVETHDDPEGPPKPPRIQPSNEVEIRAGDPELTIQKSQAVNDGEPTTDRKQVKAGDRVTYYLTVTNIGNGTAYDVVVTDEIPAGLTLVSGSISDEGWLLSDGKTIAWQVESMEPGESITVSFQVTVPKVDERTLWENVALLTYDEPDDHIPDEPNPDDPTPDDPAPGNPDPDDPHRGRTPIPSNIVEIEELIIDVPETGDDMSLQLWITLFVISGFGLITTGAFSRKGKSRK